MAGKCFACDKRLGKRPSIADTRDGQFVFVGSECYRLIVAAGEVGYQPPLGGPRLYRIPQNLSQRQLSEVRSAAIKAARTADNNAN